MNAAEHRQGREARGDVGLLGRYLSADLPKWPGWSAVGIEGPMTGCVGPVAVHANPRDGTFTPGGTLAG